MSIYKCTNAFKSETGKHYYYGDKIHYVEFSELPLREQANFTMYVESETSDDTPYTPPTPIIDFDIPSVDFSSPSSDSGGSNDFGGGDLAAAAQVVIGKVI